MKFEIDKGILKATDKCRKNFSCLDGDKGCMCEIEDHFNNTIHFIKPLDTGICDYRMSFGYSYICNCPTRKEIYKRYNA